MDIRLYFLETAKPVKFYGYSHITRDRIMEFGDKELYTETKSELLKRFIAEGIKAHNDNKIVFEMDMNGKRIFIGFFDWTMSIGLDVVKW